MKQEDVRRSQKKESGANAAPPEAPTTAGSTSEAIRRRVRKIFNELPAEATCQFRPEDYEIPEDPIAE